MLSMLWKSKVILLLLAGAIGISNGLQQQHRPAVSSRREVMGWIVAGGGAVLMGGAADPAWGASAVQDNVDVDSFLRSGVDIGGNMGVSSQAGKSKPVTGVYFR